MSGGGGYLKRFLCKPFWKPLDFSVAIDDIRGESIRYSLKRGVFTGVSGVVTDPSLLVQQAIEAGISDVPRVEIGGCVVRYFHQERRFSIAPGTRLDYYKLCKISDAITKKPDYNVVDYIKLVQKLPLFIDEHCDIDRSCKEYLLFVDIANVLSTYGQIDARDYVKFYKEYSGSGIYGEGVNIVIEKLVVATVIYQLKKEIIDGFAWSDLFCEFLRKLNGGDSYSDKGDCVSLEDENIVSFAKYIRRLGKKVIQAHCDLLLFTIDENADIAVIERLFSASGAEFKAIYLRSLYRSNRFNVADLQRLRKNHWFSGKSDSIMQSNGAIKMLTRYQERIWSSYPQLLNASETDKTWGEMLKLLKN